MLLDRKGECGMSLIVYLPGRTYSNNKKEFVKIRTYYGVKKWTGSGWLGPDAALKCKFKSAALAAGRTPEFDGDILIPSGNPDFVSSIVELSIDLHGKVIDDPSIEAAITPKAKPKKKKRDYSRPDVAAERRRLVAYGASPAFIEKWLKMYKGEQ